MLSTYSVSKGGYLNSSGAEAVVILFLLGGVGTATFRPRGESRREKQDRGASVPDRTYHPSPPHPQNCPGPLTSLDCYKKEKRIPRLFKAVPF